MVVALTGCALFGVQVAGVSDVDHEDLIDRPAGPVVLVAEGTTDGVDWTIHAFRSADGECLSTRVAGSGEAGGGCSRQLVPLDGFGIVTAAVGGSPSFIYGFVSTDATQVRVHLAVGGSVDASAVSLKHAGIDAHAFVAVLPADADPTDLFALDRDGLEIGHIPFR